MGWRKENRRKKQVERPFARRLKYESAKEALGKLVEWGGAGVGMLVGLGSAKYGLPVSPAVASTGGAIIGGMVGSQGKAFVVAGIDHFRERHEQRKSSAPADGSRHRPRRRTGSSGGTGVVSVARAQGSSASIAGQVIGGLDNVMAQLNRASRQLAKLHRTMWASQNELNAVLAGGRPDVVGGLEDALTTARNLVLDSPDLLRTCTDTIRGYRSRI
ncbi:hypothetical protein GCM10009541_47300 [Micromonospora gifhornensis]|uniref:Uncharacterized protein n=1 Tax=Micromonospora gifhornensis TaxID=84594 RepID=A0ABQ4I6E5_9ACTN|nr:hypothetical protein [Micromonospora gifhornensis]GIJ13468.1 hypothetical protein Vgi01_01520 [Micromonospora gifhornensis]